MLKFIAPFLFGLFYLLAAAATPAPAKIKTWSCTAVDVVAQVTGSTNLITVGVFGSTKKKRCHFVINLRARSTNRRIKKALDTALPNLVYMRNYARRKLNTEERKKFPAVIKDITKNFVYLLAAPGLVKGGPPKKLEDIIRPQKNLIEKCLVSFYTGERPSLQGKQVSCKIAEKAKNTLRTLAEYGKVSYALYIFR